eukprot:Nk52_evm3s418 gene=Nk52_evmTU3s418
MWTTRPHEVGGWKLSRLHIVALETSTHHPHPLSRSGTLKLFPCCYGQGVSAKLWDCCTIAPLTRAVEDSTLKCIDVDMVANETDFVSHTLYGFSVQKQTCTFEEKVMTYKRFTQNVLKVCGRNSCGVVLTDEESGNLDISFVLLFTLFLGFLYSIMCLSGTLSFCKIEDEIICSSIRWDEFRVPNEQGMDVGEQSILGVCDESKSNYYCEKLGF